MISRIISTLESENSPGAFVLNRPGGNGQAGSQLLDFVTTSFLLDFLLKKNEKKGSNFLNFLHVPKQIEYEPVVFWPTLAAHGHDALSELSGVFRRCFCTLVTRKLMTRSYFCGNRWKQQCTFTVVHFTACV